jgi:hypothetical protein
MIRSIVIRSRRALALACAIAPALVVGAGCATAEPAQKPATQSQLGAAAEAWSKMEQPKEFVEFFDGTFESLGFRVEETGEEFTVHLRDGRFTFEGGLAENVDGVVPLKQENVDRMVSRVSDGKLDAEDAYAIMRVLFTPLTREALKSSVASDQKLKEAGGIEDHMHVILLDPQGNEGASHTLVFKGNGWEVTEGKVGDAQRTFRLTAMQAREYQQRILSARKRNDPVAWLEFGSWYREWREGVSTVASAPSG